LGQGKADGVADAETHAKMVGAEDFHEIVETWSAKPLRTTLECHKLAFLTPRASANS
jgi:hypothetical protein